MFLWAATIGDIPDPLLPTKAWIPSNFFFFWKAEEEGRVRLCLATPVIIIGFCFVVAFLYRIHNIFFFFLFFFPLNPWRFRIMNDTCCMKGRSESKPAREIFLYLPQAELTTQLCRNCHRSLLKATSQRPPFITHEKCRICVESCLMFRRLLYVWLRRLLFGLSKALDFGSSPSVWTDRLNMANKAISKKPKKMHAIHHQAPLRGRQRKK